MKYFGIFIVFLSLNTFSDLQLKTKNPRYSEIDDSGFKKMDLSAEEAMLYGQDVRLSNYILKIFQKKGKPMLVESPKCFYDKAGQKIKSADKVKISFNEGVIEGVGYDVDVNENNIRIRSQVKAVFKVSEKKK